MRRAGRLTGSGTGIVALFAVLVSVVRGPAIFEPDVIGGIVTEFIGLLRTVFALQLLAEFDSTGRAILNAAAAGDAVLRIDFRGVSGSGEVRSVEQHGGTKRVTDLDVAVAKSKDLVGAVDVGRLMDETVLLSDFEDAHDFVSVDVVAGLLGLDHVIRHVTNGDTPVVRVVGTADAALVALIPAGARRNGISAVIFVEPVRDMLDVDGGVLGLDGLFDGDDVHADAGAAFGDHLSQTHGLDAHHGAVERLIGHELEVLGQFRIFLIPLGMLVEHFGDTGNEGLDGVLLDLLGVLAVPLGDTEVAHLFENVLEMKLVGFGLAAHQSGDLVKRLRLTPFHLERDLRHLVGSNGLETDGIVVMRTGFTTDMGDHVGPV